MYSEFFVSKGLLHLPILAMALFAITFAAVVLRTLFRGAPEKDVQDHLASLPFSEPGEGVTSSGDDHE